MARLKLIWKIRFACKVLTDSTSITAIIHVSKDHYALYGEIWQR